MKEFTVEKSFANQVSPAFLIEDSQEITAMTLSSALDTQKKFRPREGWTFVSVDYSGAEMRIAANLAHEQVWIDAFKNGKDVHRSTAAAMFKVPYEDVTNKQRTLAKTGTFGSIFGGTVPTLAKNAGISQDEADVAYKALLEGLSGFTQWAEEQKVSAREHQCTTTYFGRKRDLQPYYASGEQSTMSYADRVALNHPIKGTADDVMKLAMTQVQDAIQQHGISDVCRMVLTIYDEINFEIKTDHLDRCLQIIVEAMTIKINEWPLDLVVDVEAGSSWGDTERYSGWLQGQ